MDTPVIYSPSVTMSLSSACVTEKGLMFSNSLTLFVLCLKGKMQFFQLGVRLSFQAEQEKSSKELIQAGVDDQWALMAADGLVTAPRHWGLSVHAVPSAKQMALSTARNQAGHKTPRLCMISPSCGSTEQLSALITSL